MAVTAFGRKLPNIDKFGERAPSAQAEAALAAKSQHLGKKGGALKGEPRLGVPTFVWGSQVATVLPQAFRADPKATPGQAAAAARAHLGQVEELYNLADSDVASAPIRYIHDLGSGPVVVKMQQAIDGIEIFREELNVVMNQKLDLIAVTGYISSQSTPASNGSLTFRLPNTNAASNAVQDVTLASSNASQLVAAGTHDGYDYFTMAAGSGVTLVEPVRVKKVFFHMPDGLEPAYYVEVIAQNATDQQAVHIDNGEGDSDGYAYVISAIDGSILFRKNLSNDAQGNSGQSQLAAGGFTYRVWADPVTGIPYDTPAGNGVHPKIAATPDGVQYGFLPMQNVLLPNYPFSQNDPWLAAGSTQTNGNNVEAFADLQTPDGFTPAQEPPVDPPLGDHHAFANATDSFLYTHQPDVDAYSAAARQAAITQLFYNINFLHDWYYDSGFNELAGNAQKNNFGRGGLQADDIKGQAEDFQSFSNANMLTPADGGRPRMRMYNFPNPANTLDVSAPAAIAGKYPIGISQTGLRNFDLSNGVVIATFTAGPTTCTITNAAALAGKIAMFDFDNTDATGCSFSTRITRIHATSALGALMVYTSGNPGAVANITGLNAGHTKGIGVISWNTGQIIKGVIGGNTVTARLLRVADRDGSLDQQIVFHEWGHYLSNRLIGNSSGLNTNYSGGMGEGWGDFSAMMLTVRQDDSSTPSNTTFNGAYALATYATSGVPFNGAGNQGYYFGIRRYPYSTDMTKNPLTFQHIQNGTALPVGPAVAFGQTGSNNAEVHNTGEVWTTMLWECYAALLRDTLGANPRLDFATAQSRMKQYLVASLKMTPFSPTMLETRDAVLAAAAATDIVDYREFRQAFAKRGAGLFAVSPDRYSLNNVGVTESYVSGGDLSFVSATIDDSTGSCDNDGYLDNNETGRVTVTLKNTGDQTLSASTATLTSSNPNVVFSNGGVINFPTSDPTSTVIGTVGVTLTGAGGNEQIPLTINYNDPGFVVAGPHTATAYFKGNRNEIAASTATDDVEAAATQWTTSASSAAGLFTNFNFTRVQDPAGYNHSWFGPDSTVPTDISLTSPVFTVNGSGSLNLQFDHSFGFEFSGTTYFDGGVVEMSVNGGGFTNISTAAYNGAIASGGGNALSGRTAFVATSGTIHTSLTAAIAPGSTVQVRFRVGSDSGIGAAGWTIDNIAMTGVVETPFTTIVGDPGCTASTSTLLATSANPAAAGNAVTLTATVSSLRGAPATGTVTFKDGAATLATNAVSAGVATYTTSALASGAHVLTASYSGTPGFAASNSNTINESITKATSTTVLASSANPQTLNGAVTYTATVTASNGATPTGSVTFFEGATNLSTATLNASGAATWSTTYATGGTHVITATYNGSGTINSSTSSSFNEYIDVPAISFSPASYFKLENGGTVTLTLTRTGGTTTGASSVSFTTADGTAAAGNRYTTTNVTVNFAAGETSKTVDVPLINNSSREGAQTFSASIASPIGATVTAPVVAIVTVNDDDVVNSDFSTDADGKRDILWRNPTTGDTRVWLMNNTAITSSTLLQNQGSPLVLIGSGDFNNDGHADLVWRSTVDNTMTVWYMNGTVFQSGAPLAGSTDPNWVPVAIGDLNADGYPDVVWRHATTGTGNVWLMRNTTLLSVIALPTVPDLNWKVIGIGDFNRDHKNDLVWRNSATLDCAVWLMNGTTFTTAAFLPKVGTPWQLVGIGDMNGDGDADMIWQTTTTHQIALWQMNQTAFGSAYFIDTTGDSTTANDPNWKLMGPK